MEKTNLVEPWMAGKVVNRARIRKCRVRFGFGPERNKLVCRAKKSGLLTSKGRNGRGPDGCPLHGGPVPAEARRRTGRDRFRRKENWPAVPRRRR